MDSAEDYATGSKMTNSQLCVLQYYNHHEFAGIHLSPHGLNRIRPGDLYFPGTEG